MLMLRELSREVAAPSPAKSYGRILSVRGAALLARIPHAALGDLCYVQCRGSHEIPAQVVAFNEDTITLAPFGEIQGLTPGAIVTNTSQAPRIRIPSEPLGSVLSPLGEQLTAPTAVGRQIELTLMRPPPPALERRPIRELMPTGVKSIDLLCSLAYGQRVGLFAGAGVGKSTLLGMIARNAAVDVTVVGLVGERGREVREFIDDCLGPEGLKRAVVVVATSDESPSRRMLAPMTATAIAEHYREQGKRVLLLLDSLTRTARAIREVTLAAGEVPVRQGYTPSVYTELPKLLERSGNSARGSMTAIYTVLTDGETQNDPLAEEVKSILDGHLVLRKEIAQQGIRPALDLTESVSRLMARLHSSDALSQRQELLKILARLKRDKDIVLLGGTPDPELKAMLALEPQLTQLLNQSPETRITIQQAEQELQSLLSKYVDLRK